MITQKIYNIVKSKIWPEKDYKRSIFINNSTYEKTFIPIKYIVY